VNSEVLKLKFFFIASSLSGVRVDSVANFGFSSKAMNKRHGLLCPKVRNNIQSINQSIGGLGLGDWGLGIP